MTTKESPIIQDIFLNSTAIIFDNNEDSQFSKNLNYIDISTDIDYSLSSFDLFSSNYSEELQLETIPIDQFLSETNLSIPSIILPVHKEEQVSSVDSSTTDLRHQSNISLSFTNPPEPVYHVRYLSEITNSPPNGNIVNTRMKTKKYTSGRYLKGIRNRYITISLPSVLSYNSNLYIRVTRLTVPYQDISFIHPYPLLYLYPKKKTHCNVIIQNSSIYFQINKEDIYSHSKCFPNISLTRLKQCQLKNINYLYSFDNNKDISHPFMEKNVKNRIALYQLKKSQLDFRLAIRCEKTEEFFDTNIFCRSDELLEEEGIELKKI